MISDRRGSGGFKTLGHMACGALVACFCLMAFLHSFRSLRGLEWPYDSDMFRDIALAQTIADGGWPADPYYAGELSWYPPLVPVVVALCSTVSGIPVPLVYTRGGAFFDLLCPIALYLLVARLFGCWAGLASVVSFLFLGPTDLPSWAMPTYSPWMFPATFVQGIFYVGLAMLFGVAVRGSNVQRHGKVGIRFLAVGAVLGLTFLGHAAPAIILAACIGVVLLMLEPGAPFRPRALRIGLLGLLALVAALLVSSPFLANILFHYHLHIQNPVPNNWNGGDVLIGRWRALGQSFLAVENGVAVLGLVALLVNRDLRWQKALLLTWILVSGGLFGYGYVQQLYSLPAFIPQYHFLFYVRASLHVLFGFGVVTIAKATVFAGETVARRARAEWFKATPWIVAALVCAICIGWVLSRWGNYANRTDFVGSPAQAFLKARRIKRDGVVDWLRANTRQGEVVLADFDDGLFLVGPAGRRVVATYGAFSNPYIALAPREAEHRALFLAFRSDDEKSFRRLAGQRGVRHVLLSLTSRENPVCASFSREVYSRGDAIICRVDDPSPGIGR